MNKKAAELVQRYILVLVIVENEALKDNFSQVKAGRESHACPRGSLRPLSRHIAAVSQAAVDHPWGAAVCSPRGLQQTHDIPIHQQDPR